MLHILGIFWFIRTVKAILFWLYLWQLKEYHIGRFKAHFQTAKGKQLLLNKLFFSKIIILCGFFILQYISVQPGFFDKIADFFLLSLVFAFFAIYFIEAAKAINDYISKSFLKPVLTIKIRFLFFIVFIFTIGFLFFNLFYYSRPLVGLLLFDIFTPIVVSLIVLAFQPFTVLLRNRIIKKATIKREKYKNLLVIGITGSYGKTSTKEFLYTILSEKFGKDKILKTTKHQNSEIGISQCILNNLKPEHKIFICEMGAYNRGGIKLLCDIAKPKIGILTGINQQHMATFGSQENIIKTKFELIESLPEDGTAILNGDNENIKSKISTRGGNSKFYSIKEKMDFWAYNIEVEKEFVSFKVFSKDGDFAEFKVNLLGAKNIENILAAACCAKELGMNLKQISRACAKIEPMSGSGKLIKNKQGINIIDASYSANPNGVISHLEYLKIWQGKKIIIMPCLIELGKAAEQVHQEIGEKIGEVCDLAIITTKECYNNMKESAIKSGMSEQNILFLENPKQIFEKINSFSQKGDIILLESRVPKKLIKELKD
ncbi:hypothetical protein KAS79_01215 [Candidatus Parcubacteria bacterium]|nr:hypothetical protein [Candidatus Parcubacteria bacterium]